MMNLKTQLVIQMLSGALSAIKLFVDGVAFKEITDKVLNAVESKFPEGSLLDESAEMICGAIRNRLDVEDSNPDN